MLKALSPSSDIGFAEVLIIVIDSLRRDHLGIYGYGRDTSPHIDDLGAYSLVFHNAVSQSSWAGPALASLFTGSYPSSIGAFLQNSVATEVSIPEEATTFARAFKSCGYDSVAAFSANEWMRLKTQLGRGFGQLELFRNAMLTTDADDINACVLPWISEHRDQSFVLYIHYMDVHPPFDPPEPYFSMFRTENFATIDPGMRKKMWRVLMEAEEGEAADDNNLFYYIDRYDGAIRYVDDRISDIFARLRQLGIFDRTAILVTSDHGQSFFEHGFVSSGRTLHGEAIDIPLIIKLAGAGMKGRMDLYEKVGTIDMAPAMLALAGCPPVPGMDGVDISCAASRRMAAERILFTEELSPIRKGPPKVAALKGDYKALLHLQEPVAVRLYDTTRDRGETRDLSPRLPELAMGMEKEIIDRLAAGGLRPPGNETRPPARRISPKTADNAGRQAMEKIKTLGYVK